MSPSGVSAILALIMVGALLGRRVDARWLIAAGLLMLAAGNFWMSQLNLDISPWQAVWPRVVMILGLGMIFAPLNVAAYLYIPLTLRGAAVGLFALLRNEGGSFGTSIGQTITERREIFHALRLNENLDRLNPAVHSYLGQVQQGFLQQRGDLAAANRMALQSLEESSRTTGLGSCLFRRVPDFRGSCRGTCLSGAPDEALRRRKRRSSRRGIAGEYE
jgi:DHA2 family multidrug resistance protein